MTLDIIMRTKGPHKSPIKLLMMVFARSTHISGCDGEVDIVAEDELIDVALVLAVVEEDFLDHIGALYEAEGVLHRADDALAAFLLGGGRQQLDLAGLYVGGPATTTTHGLNESYLSYTNPSDMQGLKYGVYEYSRNALSLSSFKFGCNNTRLT